MTNSQARLLASAIAIAAGAQASASPNLDANVGIVILFVAAILFVVEFVRLQRGPQTR